VDRGANHFFVKLIFELAFSHLSNKVERSVEEILIKSFQVKWYVCQGLPGKP
jgi:hypothetical protein